MIDLLNRMLGSGRSSESAATENVVPFGIDSRQPLGVARPRSAHDEALLRLSRDNLDRAQNELRKARQFFWITIIGLAGQVLICVARIAW